ncbi:MAG: hypothetical protein GC185_02570 [Alphaproteobacteria bacterium]|nr:hypothetical protein [Alphaproteobacteria bacterium]
MIGGTKKTFLLALSVVAGAGALYAAWRASGADLAALGRFAGRISPFEFFALMGFSGFFILVNAERWLYIYNVSHAERDARIHRRFSIGAMSFSHVLVHFLPVQLAAVAARLLALKVTGSSAWKSVVGTTVVEQAVDLSLTLCAGVSLLVFIFNGHHFWQYGACFTLLAAPGAAIVSLGAKRAAEALSKVKGEKGWRKACAETGRKLADSALVAPGAVTRIYLFSLLRLCAYAGLYGAVALFMDMGPYATDVPLVMPVVQLANVFPLAPGNIGILEGALYGLLFALGVPHEVAGLFALTARPAVFLANLCLLPVMLSAVKLSGRFSGRPPA